ncbi:hypothetical protein [Nocardia inohanensis]|uniref:hypothetical protein n=1 Tax=Nocardia inohanensis TaxID=209246 RepID=UPI000831E6FF|nr:hypothetical protein [Nocardia inohanensis]
MKRKIDLYVLIGAAVLLVASLTAAGVTGYLAWQERQSESARDDSVVVARRAVDGMFGYSYQSVDQQMAKVTDDMTPDFKQDWNKVVSENISKSAKEKELVVTANIQATGVLSASADKADVMVFLNQKSVGKDPATGSYIQSRLKVSLEKQGSRWLVADVNPI